MSPSLFSLHQISRWPTYLNPRPTSSRSHHVALASSKSHSTAPQTVQHQQQQQSSAGQLAAAAGTTLVLAAASPSAYHLLSTLPLPPVSTTAEVIASALAGALTVLKALHGDNIHLEFHKGRLYLQLGIPSSGPAIQPGSIITQPTGDVRGNGAYATQVIPAGTYITDYAGEVLDNHAFFSRYPDGVGDYVMAIDQDLVIDAAAWVAATDSFHPVHMNHSRHRANVVRFYNRGQGRISFFASRDIQPGEELLYNYGANYWRGREHLELP